MINFFRKIRQNLLNQGKTTRYFKYAIGEIVLVVIGILIALQINDWNQRRIDRGNEDRYLMAIVTEIESNNQFNKGLFWTRVDKKLKGLNVAKAYAEDRLEVVDKVEFINSVGYGAVASGGYLMGDTNIYDELISTGNMRLISDDKLKKAIVTYYTDLMAYNDVIKIHATQYLNFINEIRPFDPDHPNQISKYDQDEGMKAYKTEEFRKNIDSELSYTYKVKQYLTTQGENGNKLMGMIEKNLNQTNKVQ
jgi:hypothetical protein